MKTSFILILCGLLCAGTSFSQSAETKVLQKEVRIRPYLLQSQVKSVPEFETQVVSKTEIVDSRFFRLVRFEKVLRKEQRASLEAAGVKFEGYIPYNAYLLSFPTSFKRNLLSDHKATHVVTLSLENKISKPLAAGIAANEWQPNEALDLLVQCYLSVNQKEVETDLKKLGIANTYGTLKRTYSVQARYENVKAIINLPSVKYVEIAPGKPVPDDTKGRSLHRSNTINTSYYGGLKYDGKGVAIALADDGHVGPHIDFKGRMTSFTQDNNGTHGDMTSGICMGAANLDPRYKGMASGAHLYLFDIGSYPQINNAISNLNNLKTVITSTSYSEGCNQYTTTSADGDNKLYENSPLMFVFSGGNNGTGDCGYGAGAGWGNITGGYKNGKNVMAAGNVDPNGVIDGTSSKGPAPDGRIKPDICANGLSQMSTDENNTYSVGGGTSAACPGLAGVTAQLYQAWKEIKGEANPEGALIKGILLNTADDLGKIGPDFTYGWGRVNARKALKTIEENRYVVRTMEDDDTVNFPILVPPGAQNLKVMIYWADPAGTPNSEINLVNNLDLRVKKPDGTFALPWILKTNPLAADLNAAAGNGVDDLNNMEQVSLDVPAAGLYTVSVKGKSIPEGPQKFYIIYQVEGSEITVTYPFGGEDFVPGQAELLRWDAVGTATAFNVSYSADSGQTWTSIANPGGATRQLNWTVPANLTTGRALIRVSRGADSDVSDHTFAIVGVPSNVRILSACADSMKVAWNAVTGASHYEVSILGAKYMDSVGTTTATELSVPYNLAEALWYSVCAVYPNGNKGRRAVARQKTAGLINCVVPNDAQMSRALSPQAGLTYNCTSFSNYPVKIMLRNRGNNTISNIPVSYKLNNNPSVSEVAPVTLAVGDSAEYQFATGLNLAATTTYKLILVADLSEDVNYVNDSLVVNFTTAANPSPTLTQSFQSATFPPTAWTLTNFGGATWVRSPFIPGPLGLSTYAAKMDNFTTNLNGSKDYLTSPVVDLSTFGEVKLTFDRAYAPRLNRKDSLLVLVSTDCGITYQPTGYAKDYAQLATAPAKTTLFTPANVDEWKGDTLNLSAFAGSKILIRFVAISRFGNVLYIDNVKTNGILVANQSLISSQELSLYPDPAERSIHLRLPANITSDAQFSIYGMDGRMMRKDKFSETGNLEQEIEITDLAPGIYQLVVEDKSRLWQSRFVKK